MCRINNNLVYYELKNIHYEILYKLNIKNNFLNTRDINTIEKYKK